MALIQQNEHTGMKMTEVGWIPKDWEVKTLGEVGSIMSGGTPSTSNPDFWNGDINWFTPSEITNSPKYVSSSERKITKLGVDNSGARLLPIGTILLTTRASIGDCAILEKEGTTNQGFHPIIVNEEITNNEFIYYVLGSLKGEMLKNSLGSTFLEISPTNLKSIRFALPISPSEQRRIAQVLSDTDSLIASLSRTIEKKRLVKQGAMQQLLTGKTRLKGFSGEWVEKVIGNIGKTYNGITGKTKADFGCGNARYITFLNVLNNPIIDINILERVNINFDEGQNEVRRGDLFFNTSSETPEEVGICATLKQNVEEVYLNSFCFGFRISDEDVDNQYLAYYFRSEQGRALMTMLAQGATRYNLSKDNFNKSCIVLPPTRDEQQAIANILTTMDNEIASLEAELQKYKALKQGMMQKLLTGQIRLTDSTK